MAHRVHADGDADNSAQLVTGATGVIHQVWARNAHATDTVYLQIFAARSGVTVGTTAPDLWMALEPGVNGFHFGDEGIAVGVGTAGITYACTTTRTGSTDVPANVDLCIAFT